MSSVILNNECKKASELKKQTRQVETHKNNEREKKALTSMQKGVHQSLKINATNGGEIKEQRTKDNTFLGTEIDGEIAPRSTETIRSNESNVDGYSAELFSKRNARLLPPTPDITILENVTLADPSGVDILVVDLFHSSEQHGNKVSYVASQAANNPAVEVYGIEFGIDTLIAVSKSDSPPEVINISMGSSAAQKFKIWYPNFKTSFEEENGLKIGAEINDWPTELKEKFKLLVEDHVTSLADKYPTKATAEKFPAAVQTLVDRGSTVVMSAGNEGAVQKTLDDLGIVAPDLFFQGIKKDLPPGCIVVGASESNTPDSAPAGFTTPAGEVDMAADGTDVNVSASQDVGSGTSFAAPQIAGLVADMKVLDPSLTPAEIEQILIQSATLQPGEELLLGAGVVDREKALEIVKFQDDHSYRGKYLLPNQTLQPNQFLESSNGKYQLLMQRDGNLVLYENYSVAAWHSGTTNMGECKLALQGDGNLVLYNTDNQPVWHSGTVNSEECRLLVQDDGNIVLYDNDTGTAVWDSGVPWQAPPEDKGGS